MNRITLIALVLATPLILAAGDAELDFKIPMVRQAWQKYEAAKNGYEIALKRGIALAKADGDEEQVKLLTAHLAALNAESGIGIDANALAGRWRVDYTNGAVRTYLIEADGRVRFLEKQMTGQVSRRNGDLILDFGDGKLERLKFEPALRVEHFNPASSYPSGQAAATASGFMQP